MALIPGGLSVAAGFDDRTRAALTSRDFGPPDFGELRRFIVAPVARPASVPPWSLAMEKSIYRPRKLPVRTARHPAAEHRAMNCRCPHRQSHVPGSTSLSSCGSAGIRGPAGAVEVLTPLVACLSSMAV